MSSITCQQLLLAVVVLLGATATCHDQNSIKNNISSYDANNQSHINSVHPTTFPFSECGQSTLHGVYMTVLLVLVAVTITMTTLVVYMCLMMRRAKSGRVPQTTTRTTHNNNMAASDYYEPISMPTTNTGNGYDSNRVSDTTPHNNMVASDYCEPISLQKQQTRKEQAPQGTIENATYGHSNHHSHPPIAHPPTSNTVYNMLHEATPSNGGHKDTRNTVYSMLTNAHEATPSNGGHEYENVDGKKTQSCEQ